jgi:5-methylcytosine-specific restriction protein B
MEKQFEYLIKLAKEYRIYDKEDQALFEALQSLDQDKLRSVYDKYGDPENRYQPVNMLRAEVAGKLLNGEDVIPETIEEIKSNITDKKRDQLEHLPKEQLNKMEASTKKTDAFSSWRRNWPLFHTFFYRDTIKETVRQYLKQITKQLISDLELTDYQVHTVDFNGAQSFGSSICWLALYPSQKESHREAYQFFVRFGSEPKAGLMAGGTLKESLDESQPEKKLESVSSYSEVVEVLHDFKNEILQRNQGPKNYYKFSPGSQAIDWDWFKEERKIGVGFKNLELGNISDVKSRQELNKRAGMSHDSESNQTWNVWLFKTANIGDIVFANQGVSKVLGIGIISGEYEYHEDSKYPYQREVEWITTKVYDYKSKSYQNYTNLFRPDTFSPTKAWQFVFSEYARLYPELSEVFDEHDLDYSSVEAPKQDVDDLDEQTETSYWWLNANPSMWSLSDQKIGNRQTYTSRNEKGNKRRIYKYFESVQPGDLMIGYESSPSKQIRAIMQITEELHQSEDEGEVIEFEIVEKLEVPVSWNELKVDPSLQDCEVFINNQGSLFSLTEEEYDIIRATIDQKNISEERKLESSTRKPYDFDKDADKPFMSRTKFEEIISILKRKKNIILQGPPGVGKTFIARKLAYQIMGYENDSQIEVVQFHQSYSYEDFIQGLRINESGTNLRNGIFYEFCQKAHTHKDRDFFIIIDEINRGNLSKIFGELLMLIEADKRNSSFATKLTYAEDEEDTFFVPPNLHLIGTMNTADRSLSIIDYALRRRFAFISLEPKFENNFSAFLESQGISQSLGKHIRSSVKKVNEVIKQDLNEGFRIGHSYFCTFNNNQSEEEWFKETIEYEIRPLLEEIWFDHSDRVRKMYEILNR